MENQHAVRPNHLLRKWSGGTPTINGWLGIPDGSSAEVMAHAGWDSVTIDMQHGLVDYRDAVGCLRAISTTDAVPMARVPWLDPGIIMKMLDAGAYGIICPMISTAEEARRFASCCRYPPRGTRSTGPIRAALYAGPAYQQQADDLVISFAMIETLEGMRNLDAICEVEELDGIYIGPSDLSLTHGFKPGFDREEPEMLAAIETVIAATRRAGKYLGIHCGSVSYGKRMIDMGANMITVGSDLRFIAAGAGETVKSFGTTTGRTPDAKGY